ncbi:hypothetical protein STEG23_012611 [Scotinomys teguina]
MELEFQMLWREDQVHGCCSRCGDGECESEYGERGERRTGGGENERGRGRVQHIVGNLFMQLVLGIPLEMVHKGLRVGLVYLAGVLAGSLASSIFDPLKSLVGASGGVYALMGGYFMNVIVNFREMIPAFGIVRLLIIILIVASDMGFALYRRFFVPANGSQVSFAAHIAGGFAGMSIGYTVFSCFDKTLLKDPRFWIAIAAKSSHRAEKTAFHLNCGQDPVQTVKKQDTGELIAPLCQDKGTAAQDPATVTKAETKPNLLKRGKALGH